MKGNFHVQFLGEGVAATSPPYPTPGWATTPVYPAQVPFKLAPMARSRLLVSRSLKRRSTTSWRVQLSLPGVSPNQPYDFDEASDGH